MILGEIKEFMVYSVEFGAWYKNVLMDGRWGQTLQLLLELRKWLIDMSGTLQNLYLQRLWCKKFAPSWKYETQTSYSLRKHLKNTINVTTLPSYEKETPRHCSYFQYFITSRRWEAGKSIILYSLSWKSRGKLWKTQKYFTYIRLFLNRLMTCYIL